MSVSATNIAHTSVLLLFECQLRSCLDTNLSDFSIINVAGLSEVDVQDVAS